MPLKKRQIVSAQVILHPASGKPIDGQSNITAVNIKDYTPSPETIAAAKTAFTGVGFEVGEFVGISFSITAPVSVFEKMFKTRLRQDQQVGIQAVRVDGSGSHELPLEALSVSMTDLITSVTFTRPPDFGPREFF